jgi:hypothetical protein
MKYYDALKDPVYFILIILTTLLFILLRIYFQRKNMDESADYKILRSEISRSLSDLSHVIDSTAYSAEQMIAVWVNYHRIICDRVELYKGKELCELVEINVTFSRISKNKNLSKQEIRLSFNKYQKKVLAIIRLLRRV